MSRSAIRRTWILLAVCSLAGLCIACGSPPSESDPIEGDVAAGAEPHPIPIRSIDSIPEDVIMPKALTPTPDQISEHALAGGETHHWTFELEADRASTVRVEQKGIDVVLRLSGPGIPDDTPLVMDGPYGSWGVEELSWVSKVPGTYLLEVAPIGPEVPMGRYSFESTEPRQATEADHRHAEILADFCRADGLWRSSEEAGQAEALEVFRNSQEGWQQLGDIRWQLQALQRIGRVAENLGKSELAEGAYDRARLLARDHGHPKEEARNANRLVRIALQANRLDAAAERLAASEEVADRLGDPVAIAYVDNNRANLLHRQGQDGEAFRLYLELADRWEALGRPLEQLQEMRNQALVMDQQGRSAEAVELLERCVQASKAGGDEPGRLSDLVGLAGARLRNRNAEGALEALEEARASGAENLLAKNALVYSNHFEALALVDSLPEGTEAADMEIFGRAKKHYETAIALAEELGITGATLAEIELNYGALHLRVSDPRAASKLFEQAMARIDRGSNPRGVAMVHLGRGQALRQLGELGAALSELERAVSIVETERLRSSSWDFRMAFLASRHAYFEEWVDLLVELHLRGERPTTGLSYAEQALVAVERRQARIFLDSISERRQLRIEVEASLLEDERRLEQELAELDREIRGLGAEDRSAAEARRQTLLLKLDDARAQIREQHPQFANLTRPSPPSPSKIRRELLDPASELVAFALGERRSFVFHALPIDGTEAGEAEDRADPGFGVYALPGREQLLGEVAESRGWVSTVSADKARQREDALARLANLLLKPLYGKLQGKRLILVPDGFLELVPYAALRIPRPDSDERQYLLERFEVVVLPSASSLAALREEQDQRPEPDWDFAFFGDPVFSTDDPRFEGPEGSQAPPLPESVGRAASAVGLDETLHRLPHTKLEIESIVSGLVSPRVHRALGFRARKDEAFTQYLSRSRVVHLATHGLVHPERPELSALALSQIDEAGQAQDGFLYAYELYSKELAADLVVLSACETGVGPVMAGEGVRGLARAFLYAGAPSLIMSLWSVDDASTAKLMTIFYQNLLREKQNIPRALKGAQLELMRSEQWSAPAYWAPFVFVGDWRSRAGSLGGPDDPIEKDDGGQTPVDPGGKGGAFPKTADDEKEHGGDGAEGMGEIPGARSASISLEPARRLQVRDPDFDPDRYVNGIDSESGRRLEPHPAAETLLELREELLLKPRLAKNFGWWKDHHASNDPHRLPVFDVDPDRLDEAGWAVIYGPDVTPEIERALMPLLWHRRKQAGDLFEEVYLPRDDEKPMDSQRFRFSFRDPAIGFGPAEPKNLPYYLLIVGDPKWVPFELQYGLGVQYAVGRLHFDKVEDYARYAEHVEGLERSESVPNRSAAIFGVEGEDANDRFLIDALVNPVSSFLEQRAAELTGLDGIFRVAGHRKADLGRLLDHPPGFLFAAGHGLRVSNPHDLTLPERQGALVCSDYLNHAEKKITSASYFTGKDLGKRDLRGLIGFLFACYSAGAPGLDDFPDGGLGEPMLVSPYPMLSHLAKRMLAQGAQAVIGHIDRVWGTSFDWSSGEGDQTRVFTSVLHQLLKGARVGYAMEWIHQRYAEGATSLDNYLRQGFLDPSEKKLLERVRKATLDSRNYIIVGDPAVRLPGFGPGR